MVLAQLAYLTFYEGLSWTSIECKTRNSVVWWHIRDTPSQCHRLQDDNELSIKVFDFIIDIFRFKILWTDILTTMKISWTTNLLSWERYLELCKLRRQLWQLQRHTTPPLCGQQTDWLIDLALAGVRGVN